MSVLIRFHRQPCEGRAYGQIQLVGGYFPDNSDIIDEPRNSTIGGAALYTLEGFSDEEYAGLAEVFRMLTSVEVEKKWHQDTGYVPITPAAYEELVKDGYYEEKMQPTRLPSNSY